MLTTRAIVSEVKTWPMTSHALGDIDAVDAHDWLMIGRTRGGLNNQTFLRSRVYDAQSALNPQLLADVSTHFAPLCDLPVNYDMREQSWRFVPGFRSADNPCDGTRCSQNTFLLLDSAPYSDTNRTYFSAELPIIF